MKKTKKALVLSALCLLMCFTMLIGTTFAWFTDKVEVTGNRIVAGNLDVETEYMNANGVWADVESAGTNSFFTDINGGKLLWEPGVVSYAHFKVSNVGNLALRYNFSTVADDFNTVDGHSLKEIIEVYFIKQGSTAPAAYADRAAVETAINGLTAVGFDGFANENTNLAPETDEYFTVVLKWTPGATDNDYNVNNDKVTSDGKDFLWIDIDLTLVATQATAEEDSFDKYYDEAANATMVATADELADAIANGGEIALAEDITISNQLNITSDTIIYGLGNTLTYNAGGNAARVIDVPKTTNGANLTIKDIAINIDMNSGYCERGINYNTNGKLVLDNVTLTGPTKATYGINMPSSSDNAQVEIVDCDLTALLVVNVWGKNATIDIKNSTLSNYDEATHEDYVTVVLNNNGETSAEGTVINIEGGKIVARDENGNASIAVKNGTDTGIINISATTIVDGLTSDAVAVIRYKDSNGQYMEQFYSEPILQDAVTVAAKATNAVVVLLKDQTVDTLNVPANVTIDLNNHALTVTTETGAGTLTVIGTGTYNGVAQ